MDSSQQVEMDNEDLSPDAKNKYKQDQIQLQ